MAGRSRPWARRCATGAALALLATASPAWAQVNDEFDPAAFEPRPFEVGGFAELRPALLGLDPAAVLPLPDAAIPAWGGYAAMLPASLQLTGSYRAGAAVLGTRLNASLRRDAQGWRGGLQVFEGALTLKPAPTWSLDIGKKVIRWGKGYAWNPVAFISRPKDPNDPEVPLEGYTLAGIESIRSFDGPLRTAALTAVAVPVYGGANAELGGPERLDVAAKLYLLLADTDLDFMVLADGARGPRYGLDFSRNLASNVEIHGEWAFLANTPRILADPAGIPRAMRGDAHEFLLGLRYLTAAETTWIAEYFHHGAGYTRAEWADFYGLLASARASPDDGALAAGAKLTGQGGLALPNPLRHYGFVRVMQKDPFGLLDVLPAATLIASLEDGSFTVVPELLYTGVTNLEVRLRIGLNVGPRLTEFGERPGDHVAEARARYYF